MLTIILWLQYYYYLISYMSKLRPSVTERGRGSSGSLAQGPSSCYYKQHGLDTFPDESVEICIMLLPTEHPIV